jgi:PAS domain-containing protein
MSEEPQDQATQYALGLLEAEEAAAFEHGLIANPELHALVGQLRETQAKVLEIEARRINKRPPSGTLSKILSRIDTAQQVSFPESIAKSLAESEHPLPAANEGVVLSDREGLVEWISPSFKELCGHELKELKSKKLGPILQGPATDPAAATNLRNAIQTHRPVRQVILNYHKRGEPYFVDLDIRPIERGFIAIARKRTDLPLPI